MAMKSVYTATKMWRFPDRLAALESDRLAAPVHVRIKPTNVCNHACYFCAYRSDAVDLGSDMVVRDRIPREKMIEIVDDLVTMGVAAVTFSGGGEPLIYPHIVETVERLAAGGIRVATLTNGAQLRGKVADAFSRHATWVRVSIDGWDDDSYAAYRGVKPGAFSRVLANLADFSARGTSCELGASIIVDSRNAAHVAELAGKLKACGVRHAKISACVVSNDAAENDAYHAGFADTVRESIAAARDLEDDAFTVVDHYHGLAGRFGKSYHRCAFAEMLTVIAADCAVYTCQDKAYTPSGRLGSIRDRRFRDFWFSEENRIHLRGIDPSRSCLHHCVADAKNRQLSDYLGADPVHAAFV
jgi:MoaA/NifB/PqqE/SkfB family radical SAM enzyme